MADKFAFSLVCPEAELASGEANQIIAPGTEGEFGILFRHAPLVSTLKIGTLLILGEESNIEQRFFIRGGFIEVSDNRVTILAEEAIDLDNTSYEWVNDSLTRVKAEDNPSHDRVDWLEKIQARLSATKH